MIWEQAQPEDAQSVYALVQETIKTVYPKYYPAEVVDFFLRLHNMEAVSQDIEDGFAGVVRADGRIIATGSFTGNHVTRVYVLPEHQKKGCGTFIMQKIEELVGREHGRIYLDASLPAAAFYERLGFSTVKHESHPVENGAVLVYEIMEKKLW